MCLGLGLDRLVTIDILLYGASLALEFLALIILRVKEPELPRPFRVPGGMFGAIAVGITPMLMLGFSIVRSQSEQVMGMSSFTFGMLLIGGGVIAYYLNRMFRHPNIKFITVHSGGAVPMLVGRMSCGCTK